MEFYGREHEIDELHKVRATSRYSAMQLQAKTIAFFQKNPTLSQRPYKCLGLSLKDM